MKKSSIYKIIFLFLFAVAIIVPIATMDFVGGKYSSIEQRNLAGFPITKNNETGKLDVSRDSIQDWLSDNIGLREQMLKLCVNFKYTFLGQSTSEKIIIGKDGWLFYTLDNNTKIATGEYPLTDENLKTIAENQQAISDYYKSIGSKYILMLTPSKVSIYPEYLPFGDSAVDETPVDILANYLRENTDIIVYNSKDALLEAKNNGEGQLYLKTDTHWNEKGAYYVYKGLHQVMSDNGILDDEPIQPEFAEGEYKGEFSFMMGDLDILPAEQVPVASWNAQATEVKEGELYELVQQKENQYGSHQGANLFSNQNKKLTAQIYGDSQIEVVRKIPQMLAEHFSTFVKYSVRNVSVSVDEAVKPDVVIFSCSERYINPLLLQQGDISILEDGSKIPDNEIQCDESFYKGMWLDSVNGEDYNTNHTQGEITQASYQNSDEVEFIGWAADFNANLPLSALYVRAGDKTVKCRYGIERTSVSDYLQNENLKMTGFNVSIPKSYLDGIDKIEFIMIGNDGTYRFESVEYKLTGVSNNDSKNNIINKTVERQFHDSENYMWIDYINDIDLNGEDSHQLEIKKSYFNEKNTVSFVGWAADFNVNKPLSALYIKLGERLVKCDYGIERSSVSDYYGNKDLRMTGFEIEVPSSYFEGLSEFEFVQVGYDGTYRFDNVKYFILGE